MIFVEFWEIIPTPVLLGIFMDKIMQPSILTTQVYMDILLVVVKNRYGKLAIVNVFHLSVVSRILFSSKPFYGDAYKLKCIARRPPSGYGVHMHLEWFGPNEHIVEADVTIGEKYVVDDTFQRDLVFHYPTPSLNGEYRCRLTVTYDSFRETLVEESNYVLKVISKLTQYSIFLLIQLLLLLLKFIQNCNRFRHSLQLFS